MLMSTDWARFAGLPPDVVKAGCGISGLYDLEPIRLSLPERDARAHGGDGAPEQPGPRRPGRRRRPLLLAVGEREGDEYHRQTESLAAAWRRRGLAAEVMDMAGHDHFSIVTELGDPGTPLSRAILSQMGLLPRRPGARPRR